MSALISCGFSDARYTKPETIVVNFLEHESKLAVTTTDPPKPGKTAAGRRRAEVANTITKAPRTRVACQLASALRLSAAMRLAPPTPPFGDEGWQHQWDCASARYDTQRQKFAMALGLVHKDQPAFDVAVMEARIWLFTCAQKLHVHAYVTHTAVLIFDHFTSLNNVRIHSLLLVAGTALCISSKTCGGVTLLPSMLRGLHQKKKLFRDKKLGVVANTAETAWKQGCDVVATSTLRDFMVTEGHMLDKLEWLVANKITLFHFVDLLVRATGNCPAVRLESTALARKHCEKTAAYTPGVDMRVTAVQCVSRVLRQLSSVGHGADEDELLAIICQVSGQDLALAQAGSVI